MLLIIIGLLYTLISFLNRDKYQPYWGWLIILAIMGLQYSVPGDYDGYEQTFRKVATNSFDMNSIKTERGWTYLNRLFSYFGTFQLLVFAISLFEYYVLAKFIAYYTDKKFLFLSGLIFYFSMYMMIFQMKGLRQALSIEMCLLALMTIDKHSGLKSMLWSIVLVLLASTIHTSSYLMLPVIFCAIILKTSHWVILKADVPNIKYAGIITLSYLCLFWMKKTFIEFIRPWLLSLDLMGYEGYFGSLEIIEYHVLITLYHTCIVFAVSYVMQAEKGFMKFLYIMVIISTFCEMITFGLGSLFRITLALNIVSIAVLPNVSSYLYKNQHRILAWLFAGLVISYNFRTFITQTIRHSENGFDNYSFLIFNYI